MPEPPLSHPLSAPLVEQIVEETTKMISHFFGLEPAPRTAEIFGPASCLQATIATQDTATINEHFSDGWPFYLVVLRGLFAATLRYPADAPPRSIATLLMTPTAEYPRTFGLRNELPRAIALLGISHTINLDPSSG
jgi:hypothetical protein